MNQMMNPNVDITLVIRKSADGRMAVSVLPKSNTLKDEAQNSIVPLTLNGTPEELDTGFMQVVERPMQKASGLISNMVQFEAQADKAASSSKGAKEAKAKESKEDREKREKYEKNLKKAEEHIAAKRHKEAVDALTEARKYAKPDDLKTIDERLDEQKKLVGQGDLFAMMEEPEQAQPQQSQVQQPTQQPTTAQVQPQPMPEPVKPVQQPTVQQQAAPQHQSAMPQQEMPAQAAHPAQQPYGNPGQGYGDQHGYPQQPQEWPQQAIGAGGTGSQVLTNLSRLDVTLRALNHPGLFLTVYDPDIVTEANIGRQLFGWLDIGLNKAQCLVTRINNFFGNDWAAIPDLYPVCPKDARRDNMANITITCTDNVKSRIDLWKVLKAVPELDYTNNDTPIYWLDFGNSQSSGQVVLGTVPRKITQPESHLYETVSSLKVVTRLVRYSKVKDNDSGPSCSLVEALEKQDLFINSTPAQLGCNLLWKMFRHGMIEHHGLYLNLSTMKVNPILI